MSTGVCGGRKWIASSAEASAPPCPGAASRWLSSSLNLERPAVAVRTIAFPVPPARGGRLPWRRSARAGFVAGPRASVRAPSPSATRHRRHVCCVPSLVPFLSSHSSARDREKKPYDERGHDGGYVERSALSAARPGIAGHRRSLARVNIDNDAQARRRRGSPDRLWSTPDVCRREPRPSIAGPKVRIARLPVPPQLKPLALRRTLVVAEDVGNPPRRPDRIADHIIDRPRTRNPIGADVRTQTSQLHFRLATEVQIEDAVTQFLADVLVLSARIDREDRLRPSPALHSCDDIAARPSHIADVGHEPKRACDDLIRWRAGPVLADMLQACRRRRSKWDFVICQLASGPIHHDAARRSCYRGPGRCQGRVPRNRRA